MSFKKFRTPVISSESFRTPSLLAHFHCVKGVFIWSFSGPHFPAFGLTTERYSVSYRIQSECGKVRTRKTPNTDSSHTVFSTRH